MRQFAIAGPVIPERHYYIDPLSRIDLEKVLELIDSLAYFVLHAPRQTGKTTVLTALADRLNADRKYRCLCINVEEAQTARSDVGSAMAAVLDELSEHASESFGDESARGLQAQILAQSSPHKALNLFLRRWTASCPRPLVLLIDEIDAMIGDSLISVLRQLRAGYHLRPRRFPRAWSFAGCATCATTGSSPPRTRTTPAAAARSTSRRNPSGWGTFPDPM